MRIFVYEHVTGGGMAGETLPPGLLHEADLIVRSLISDLRDIAGVELCTTRDSRLAPVPGIRTIAVGPADDLPATLRALTDASDAVWPTAPETGGALARLAELVLTRKRVLLGSRPESVRLASSKFDTARALLDAKVPVVLTCRSPSEIPPIPGRWVTKPDDGAGAEQVRLAADWVEARGRLASDRGLVAQPWIDGEPLSLSLLCADGAAQLLSVNRQVLRIIAGAIALHGIEVNALMDETGAFARLAREVIAAIPGLWGHVGIDLVRSGSALQVLEVNPRLTTSYCGLHAALGVNVAARVLALLTEGRLTDQPPAECGRVEALSLQADHA